MISLAGICKPTQASCACLAVPCTCTFAPTCQPSLLCLMLQSRCARFDLGRSRQSAHGSAKHATRPSVLTAAVWGCSKSRSIIALRGPGQFIGEVLLFDNTGRDSPMGSWQTCVRARTDVRALILTVADLKDLVTRKPAAEVELRAGQAQLHTLPCVT